MQCQTELIMENASNPATDRVDTIGRSVSRISRPNTHGHHNMQKC
jgi:hypothetical protein